jgi:hypothetical protein
MVFLRWALTIVLIVIALVIDVGNACAPIIARKRGRNVSGIPLAGSLSGVAACLICPIPGSARLIPAAILLDLSAYFLVWFLVTRVLARRSQRP